MLVLQKQNIKGFSLLELMVVLAIIAGISVASYPNFNSWRVDRELKHGLEKISTIVAATNTQTQRGSYPYVQVEIKPPGVVVVGGGSTVGFTITAKGMKQNTFSNKLNAGTVPDCPISNTGTGDWDVDIMSYTTADIGTHISSNGAACFSKDGSYYGETGSLQQGNTTVEGQNEDKYIIICTKDLAESSAGGSGYCPTDSATGLINPAYLISWSRFGNVARFKWSGNEWIRQ